jgi:PAS domain S-box-containing protein
MMADSESLFDRLRGSEAAAVPAGRLQSPSSPATQPAPDPVTRHVGFAIGMAAVILAGLAHLGGAPFYVSLAALSIAVAGYWLASRARDEQARVASILVESAARNRDEVETLADRMWELQESEERFRGLIDALGDLVIHRDRDGRIVYANRVFADLVGQEPRALFGRTLSELGISIGIVPDAAFADGECLSSTDVAIQTPAGPRWFSWIELSVRDEASEQVSHRAIARDITDRKRAEISLVAARERAEFASLAKSRFLATVSHEIRTPMNGIMGMAKLLADTRLSPEQRTYVGAVSTSASALLALIEDLLDFSKIEAGRLDLEPQPLSPRELTENIVELLASRAYGKEIGLGCHIAPDVPQLIEGDPGRLRQVLLNLVGNAVKFTDQGGVLVSITVKRRDGQPMISFAVSDTGPGLAARDRNRIFEEFEQVDGTSTRRHGGAGLGLAISKRIVEAMQGTIAVESAKGKGSTFTVEIPAAGAAPEALDRSQALEGRRVLIVSANATEAEAVALTIRAHGGSAEIAATAAQAAGRAKALARTADTVLIDAAIESPDGALLKRLREAGLVAAEAVTLIAPTDRGRLGEFRAGGYPTFLARPVRGETLLRVLIAGASASPPTADLPAAAGHAKAGAPAGLRVLLAEDNDINAMLASAALTKAGHGVHVVANGKAAVEAVTAAGQPRFDVVLMDLHMPVMDGLDAIALIRKHEEEKGAPPVPIMVLSADSQEKTRHVVLAHGASGFVSKPLDPHALVTAVEEQATA